MHNQQGIALALDVDENIILIELIQKTYSKPSLRNNYL
jgi:hypothetical protein